MKKKYEDKKMGADEESTKAPKIVSKEQKKGNGPRVEKDENVAQIESHEAERPSAEALAAKICIRECEMPFVGHWKAGDVVADPAILAKIGDNPCFKDQGGTEQ